MCRDLVVLVVGNLAHLRIRRPKWDNEEVECFGGGGIRSDLS